MTVRLYNEDCYTKKFQATVEDCQPDKGVYKVVLSRTAFFPEGGGQSADTGILTYGETARVLDVRETKGEVHHVVDREILVGTVVEGEINWEERFSKMQQHTGEHIVSGLVSKMFGYNNVGFHLSNETVTMDFNGVITREQADQLEKDANQAVFANIPVEVRYPSKTELETIDYRSKIEIQGQVRIVDVQGYDTCACCAPHVKCTGEIGLIKLVDIQSHRGGVRIQMACGTRALEDYQVKSYNTKSISGTLSAKENEVYEAVVRMKEELVNTKQFALRLQRNLIEYKLSTVDTSTQKVVLFEEELELDSIRELVNRIAARDVSVVAAFQSNGNGGYHYIIASNVVDVRSIGKTLNEACNGRGGGKSMMIQGSLQATEAEIRSVLE